MRYRTFEATKALFGCAAAALLFASCVSEATGSAERPQPEAAGLAVGEAGYPDDVERTMEVVTLDRMRYDPASITVTVGETVRFVVTNEGKLPHEFTLGDAEAQAEHSKEMSGMSMAGHDHPFSVYLEPGQTKEVIWRFTRAGDFLYGCHVPGHYEAGMKAPLTVR